MKRAIAPLAALVLGLAAISPVAAARSAAVEKFTDSGSAYDDFLSEVCGFDVWLTYRTDFTVISHADGSIELYFHAFRTRTGPGGTVRQVLSGVTTIPDGVQVVGDPESGSWQEISRSIFQGSRSWTSPGAGVIYQEAGLYAATVTFTVTPDGEGVEVSDEVAHGQMPGTLTSEEIIELQCEYLA